MKTETLIERTKGEWELLNGTWYETIIYCNKKQVADCYNPNITQDEAEANAAFICKAVNNYDRLSLENETLKDCLDTYSKVKAINDSLLNALKRFMVVYDRKSNIDKLGWNSAYSEAKAIIDKIKKAEQ